MKDKKSLKQDKGLVPRLRFPEFRDAGPWEVVPLKKLASRRSEKNSSGKITRVLTNSAEHGVLDQRDYFEKDIATKGNLENYLVVDKEDFVYNPRISSFAPVGPISRNDIGKGVMSPLYLVFRFRNSETDFYSYYFKSYAWHSYLRKVGSTGARHDRMAISNDDFMVMPLPVPSPDEQQKIADCLSSLDELIELEGKKLEALKAHKKGLTQQLFPREGETTPRLRFPEFRDAGPWKKCKIGELLTLEYGASLPEEARQNGSIPVVGSNGVVGFHSKALVSGPVIIVGRKGSVGEVNWIESDCFPIDTTFYVKLKSRNSLLVFIKLLLENANLASLSDNGAVPGLNRNDVYVLRTAFPSEAEQQKIADCLSSLDELIELQSQKLEALKAHKKGLMQQLFPQEVI